MKVLLITPKFTNDINKAFNLPTSPFGGWIDGLLFRTHNEYALVDEGLNIKR